MTLGNVGALRQTDLKRLLAYSSVAHAGYLLVGLAAANEAGLAGVLFYLLAYGFMNVGAFAVAIAAERADGGDVTVGSIAGLAARKPGLAAGMAVTLPHWQGCRRWPGSWASSISFAPPSGQISPGWSRRARWSARR
jgi:NADH-quinone oxidoreductase subunit N